MDDTERQRVMDFILRQQAQFAAGMQRNEEQMTNLRRVVVMMARQFRKERSDLKERIAPLVDGTDAVGRQAVPHGGVAGPDGGKFRPL